MPARSAAPSIVLSANTCWYIANFREPLIRAFLAEGFRVVVIAPRDAATERVVKMGVDYADIAIDRSGLSPASDLGTLKAYHSSLKRIRPDAFLSFTIKPNIYGCLASRLRSIPAIATVSGLGTVFIRRGPLTWLVTWMYWFAFRRTKVVFFENRDDRDFFVSKGIITPGQGRFVPGAGIDLDHFAPAPLPEGPPKFLLIARLLGDKGVREYVEAARRLRPQLPGARFQLLGGLDEGNRSSVRATELDAWAAEGVVEHLGETNDVRPYIAEATAIILPSYREGLPRTLLEGAAMGRPLIATDVPGCRDLVEDGVNGFLCRARDPSSLAAAIAKLARLPAIEQSRMGATGRRLVEERFSERDVSRAYLGAVRAAVSARPGGEVD